MALYNVNVADSGTGGMGKGNKNSNAIAVNPDEVVACLNRIWNAAYATQHAMDTNLDCYYTNLTDAWYGKNAVKYGDNVKTSIDQLYKKVYDWCTNMCSKIRTAAYNMADTAGQSLDLPSTDDCAYIEESASVLDSWKYKETGPNGTIGIVDLEMFNSLIAFVPTAEQELRECFQKMISASSGTGFIDSSTEGAITNEAEQLKNDAMALLSEILATLKNELNSTVEVFTDTQSSNTSMFGGN